MKMEEILKDDPIQGPISLENMREIDPMWGANVEVVPDILSKYYVREGVILSEADIRLFSVRNYENAEMLANNYWDTSTLSATKGDFVMVILPYETGSNKLTVAARSGLGLMNTDEALSNHGVDLDIDDRWERFESWSKIEGSGVYMRKRDQWFEHGEDGTLIGLNEEMTEEQALRNELLLTRLGRPDHVDSRFARSTDEISEIIGETFRLGRDKFNYKSMMGIYLDDPDLIEDGKAPRFDEGVLKTWCVRSLKDKYAGVKLYGNLDEIDGRFGFLLAA
jgi:hypothetical protein